jgi:hypothetical protein
MAITTTIATAPMMIGVLLEAVATDGGAGGGTEGAAWYDAAGDGAAGCAAEAATGTGSTRGALGGTGRGGEVTVAVGEDADAEEAVPRDAGAGAGLNSTPQCTQNLAVGWFSLPQAAHFIEASSKGISGPGFEAEARARDCSSDLLRGARLLWTDRRRAATAMRGPRPLFTATRLNATIAPDRLVGEVTPAAGARMAAR